MGKIRKVTGASNCTQLSIRSQDRCSISSIMWTDVWNSWGSHLTSHPPARTAESQVPSPAQLSLWAHALTSPLKCQRRTMNQQSQNEGKVDHLFFLKKPNEPCQSSLSLLGEVQQVPQLQKYFCCWACSFLCLPAARPAHSCLGLGLSGWASCWLKFSSKANVAATGCNSTEWFNMPSGNSYVSHSFSLKLCNGGTVYPPIPRKKKAEWVWGRGRLPSKNLPKGEGRVFWHMTSESGRTTDCGPDEAKLCWGPGIAFAEQCEIKYGPRFVESFLFF